MLHKRCVSRLLLVSVAVLGAAAPAAARAATHAPITTLEPGKLKVCLYAGFAPFASKVNGTWQGWDVDYLAAFAAANSLTFAVVEHDFNGIWLAPGQKLCDVAGTGISDTAERRKAAGDAAEWSNTYYGVVRTFLVRTEQFAHLTQVEDLRGRTAIVTKGSTANTDLCYRMAARKMHPCVKPGGDLPCSFPGFELKPSTDRSCVDVEYPQDNDEKTAAAAVANSGSDYSPFTYGGGYGSVQALVCERSAAQQLATVWPHCNMSSDGVNAYAEPFSFVVRAADSGLANALDCFIGANKYAGTPIPDLGCQRPPWTPQPAACTH
jgi:hypothetical protein